MNQNTAYNPTTVPQPINPIQPVIPSPQYIPIQQDTFINTSASKPEPMKPWTILILQTNIYNRSKHDSPSP